MKEGWKKNRWAFTFSACKWKGKKEAKRKRWPDWICREDDLRALLGSFPFFFFALDQQHLIKLKGNNHKTRETYQYKNDSQPDGGHCSKESLRCWASRVHELGTWIRFSRGYSNYPGWKCWSRWTWARNAISHVQELKVLTCYCPAVGSPAASPWLPLPRNPAFTWGAPAPDTAGTGFGTTWAFGFSSRKIHLFLWVRRMQNMNGKN